MSEPRRFATSFLVGLLALPLAAAAATALVASNDVEVAEPAPSAVVPAVTAPATLPEQLELAKASDPAADLDRACGAAGLDLVEREALGELSELEQAALTALRSVCEAEGTPLPGPPAPEPVIRTVSVEEVLPAGSVVALSSGPQVFDDHEDDHEEDEVDEEHDEDHEDRDEHDDD